MAHPILFKLESIFIQASGNNSSTQQFFQLLHEFALKLKNPKLKEGLKVIHDKEGTMKKLVNRCFGEMKPEVRKLYLSQYQQVSDWYALNQIHVFLQRYNFGYYDAIIKELISQNASTTQLELEHSELMKYAITGARPNMLPTIEEYKHYMQRVIDSLDEILERSPLPLKTYSFAFDQKSNTLLIDDRKPIKLTRSKKPFILMSFFTRKKLEKRVFKHN